MSLRRAVVGAFFLGLLLAPSRTSPAPELSPSSVDNKVAVRLTSPVLNRATGTFDVHATIVNTSPSTLDPPMLLVVNGTTPSDVTLANSAGTTADGFPFVTVPIASRGLMPGRAVTVLLRFSNASLARFTVNRSVRAIVRAAPSLGAFQPNPAVVALGSVQQLTLQIQNPSATQTMRVTLSSGSPTMVSVAPTLVIPAGRTTATVTVAGRLEGGPVTVTATLGSSSATTAVSVVRRPPAPVVFGPLRDGGTIVAGMGKFGASVSVLVNGRVAGTGAVTSEGHFSVAVPPLAGGDTVRAIQSVAGLPSAPSTQITVVRAPPVAPIIEAPLVAGATVVEGSAEPGANVDVMVNGTTTASAVATSTGQFAATVPALGEGARVSAIQTRAGVQSVESATLLVVGSPPPPLVSTPLVAGTTIVAGTGVRGATVTVSLNNASIGTATVDASGTWSLAVPPLSAGGVITAIQGLAGRSSAPSIGTTVVAPPPPPTILGPLVTGGVAVAGHGTPGATVEVFVNATSAGTSTVDAGGIWARAVAPALTTGASVQAAQAVGGVSSALSPAIIVVSPPPAPSVAAPLVAGLTQVNGTGTPGLTVDVQINGASQGVTDVGADGTWTLALDRALAVGDAVRASQGLAGGVSALSTTVIVVTPPPPPVVGEPLVAGDMIVRGNGIPDASLRVFVNRVVTGSTAVTEDGGWALPVAPPLVSGQAITATQTVAGVESAPSSPVIVGAAVLRRIDISPAPSASIAQGQTIAFTARGTFSDGSVQSPLSGVQWSSDTTAVATINASGVASGLAVGTSGIRASQGGIQSAATTLTVTPGGPTSITVAPSPFILDVGATLQYQATGTFPGGSIRDVTGDVAWTSSAPAVATITSRGGLASAVTAGTTTITATHPQSGATATATLTVTRRAQITIRVAPAPLAIPPDATPHTFTILFSDADTIAHTLNLSVADTSVATVSPASVTFAAGQTSGTASVTGLRGGQTTLTITSTSMTTASVPVFVTTEFSGINTTQAPLLGVVLQSPPQSPPSRSIGPIQSSSLGLIVGSGIQNLAPSTVIIGTGPTPVVINGAGLQSVTAVALAPPDGLTLGSLTVAPDGASVTVPITVAADAPLGLRQLVVTASGQRILAATATADRLLVSLPAPVIDSVDPLFAVPGTTFGLTIRGRNLLNAQNVTLSGCSGVTIGGVPLVSADGSQLTVSVSVSASASLASCVATVTTPAGTSSASASPADTFSIVRQLVQTFSPIVSPVLGVVKPSVSTPTSQTLPLFTSALGVAFGSTATSVAPSSGVIGTTVRVTVTGNELLGVTAIQFAPNTGLTFGGPTVAADGRSASVDVTIAPDAPETVRTVRVFAGTTPIAFASPFAALFTVTPPPPQLDSISSIVIQTGTTALTLTLQGANLQNAQVVITPADGISMGPPAANADGTAVTIVISVAANAAPGQRVVTIVTPAGTTLTTSAPQNTITLTNAIGPTFTPIVAPLLGVVIQQPASPPINAPIGPIVSPNLGVVLQAPTPPPPSRPVLLDTPALGVVVGSAATSIEPPALAPGTSGTLTIRGSGLTAVTGVALIPGDGVVFGTPVVAPDGSQIQVVVNVAAGVANSVRQVSLTTAAGRVAFAQPQAALFFINGVPTIDSITPIAMCTNTASVQLTIRGHNLQAARTMTVTPADGITVGNTLTFGVEGQQGLTNDVVQLNLAVATSASVGGRVVRVVVPGFVSTDQASPANTLTINNRPVPDIAGVCPGVQGGGG